MLDDLVKIFLVVCNMSLTATFVILSVLVLRLIIRKLPKTFSYMLWLAVIFRLSLPITFTSKLSWFKSIDIGSIRMNRLVLTLAEQQLHSLTAVKNSINQVGTHLDSAVSIWNEPLAIGMVVRYLAAIIWAAGVLIMLLISIQTSLQTRRKLADATQVQGVIFETDAITSPFVFGIFKPRIILPVGLDSKSASHVLLHEQMHIRRFDHVVRIIAYMALSIHWFNPFVWLSFSLMTDDMEKSCDEHALRKCDHQERLAYCETLLWFAVKPNHSIVNQLNFGKSNAKTRITNILFFKKPILSVMVLSALFITFAGFSLIADPPTAAPVSAFEKYNGYERYFGPTLFSTLAYVASDNEIDTVAPILASAEDVFCHMGNLETANQDVGELVRYYQNNNAGIASVQLDLRLVTVKISGSQGYMWVIYTIKRFDDHGVMRNGSADVLSYWEIKNNDGRWQVTAIVEPA